MAASSSELKPGLYLVPTPIGNLDDITFRALKVLKAVDFVLAEDTRNTGKLLKLYDISAKMFSYHAHNEHASTPEVVKKLKAGGKAALVTDAGTPGISDPGFQLVRACVTEGLHVECLPGATAFVPALAVSGLPCDKFVFEGFLPQKKGRQTRIGILATEERTIVFYESPHRIVKTLKELAVVFGAERKASVSREISKMFEETVRGSLQELAIHFETHAPKGEFVLVVAGSGKDG
jgi:16S rRNA (cytidine1402-2'-O)-methyltransferase